MTTVNPFKKSTAKATQVTITLQPEQKALVEALAPMLGVKTNTQVVMEGLAALYDKHRRQLDKATAASEETTDQAE